MQMNDELKSLIEDAAKLLGWKRESVFDDWEDANGEYWEFDPTDEERGDLMKVARVAKLSLLYGEDCAAYRTDLGGFVDFAFTEGDYESEALAILRAASAVYKSRGGV